MNLAEIRKQYPQYDDLSDEKLATNFHAKFYADMPFEDFSKKIGYSGTGTTLKPLTEEQRSQAVELAKGLRPKTSIAGDVWDVAKSSVKGLASGAESYANGLSLGGYEWAGDKLGFGVSDRKAELQRQAEEANVGGLNAASNALAELGGGLRGAGKLTYNLAQKGVSGAGNAMKLRRMANSSIVPLALSGATDAAINSGFRRDFSDGGAILDDATDAALFAGAMGGVGKVKSPVSKVFSANTMTKGLKGGLNNVANSPQAVKILNSGIRQNDEIAQEFLNKVPAAARKINSETADLLNHSITRRVDIPTTVANQKAKYRDFLDKNADMTVLDMADDIPQVRRYTLDKKDYQPVLKSIRRNMQKNSSDFAMAKTPEGNIDYPHFLKDKQRAEYISTLPETFKSPQQVVKAQHQGKEREYLLKQYYNPETGSDVYDVAIKSGDGTLINKIAREGRKGKREFEKARQARTSTGGTTSRTSQTENTSFLAEQPDNNILFSGANVKNKKDLYEGLTPFQQDALQKAIAAGTAKTNHKAGSLDNINKVKQELNDMIVKSQNVNPNNRLASVDSSDTVALREVKKRIDAVLGGKLKGHDRSYRKAKELENAYDAGLRYNPSNVNSIDLVPQLNTLGRHAFSQGVVRRMTNNPLTGQNLSADALKQENTLADVLRPSKYAPLMDRLNTQSTRFGRLSNLGSKAENKLQTPEKSRLFAREQGETPGAIRGTIIDWLDSALRGRAIKQASQNLMNPDFVGLKDSWVLEKYPYLANYLSAIMPQAKNQ